MIFFLLAFSLSILFTIIVKKAALKWKIIDSPDAGRKQHGQPVALLGGLAIFFSFWLVTACLSLFTSLLEKHISHSQLLVIFISSFLLIIVGVWDDVKKLPPAFRLLVAAIAVIITIMGGVHLTAVTNPFGGIISLDFWQVSLGAIGDLILVGDILIFFWLMGMIFTAKILDGLDGLAVGIVAIGALMIFFLSNYTKYYQPDVALLSLVFAGACLGFLVFNFYPASIFLGESGGLFLGFILGVLAVISGGKIATALLVMAVPILDLMRVIYMRLVRKQPIFFGDREHLHFRLLRFGLTQRQAVYFLYAVALLFGATTLFLQSQQKLIALIFLTITMLMAGIWFRKQEKNNS